MLIDKTVRTQTTNYKYLNNSFKRIVTICNSRPIKGIIIQSDGNVSFFGSCLHYRMWLIYFYFKIVNFLENVVDKICFVAIKTLTID